MSEYKVTELGSIDQWTGKNFIQGEISVGDDTVALKAGTVVRVAPTSKLALRALPESTTPLKWLCVRSGANTIEAIGNDATLDRETPFPWAK